LRIVLDTCVLKLTTLPNPGNKSAVIWELCQREKFQIFGSPDTLGEYHRVLADHPMFLEEIQTAIELCYPFFTATAIEHEPDNRFLEVALAVQADYLITVNTARGHFDRKNYENVRVVTPGEFLKQREVQSLLAGIQ
jgi:predicted nucleic acid-binding protein